MKIKDLMEEESKGYPYKKLEFHAEGDTHYARMIDFSSYETLGGAKVYIINDDDTVTFERYDYG